MFVTEGAHSALLKSEREYFLREEWPRLRARIERMGLDPEKLLATQPHQPDKRDS